ncbi:unnamed protein product [Auanema sp. JU1783]|nr:unnamed protein product [Auanema sp. JU1783]
MLPARQLANLSRRCLSVTPSFSIQLTPHLDKGHSKWQNIKHIKGKNDLIKSKATNLLLRKAKAAISKGGFDLKVNRELASVETEFKAQGLSADTFRNFLQKMKDRPEVEYTFDVIGPSGTFFIVVAETDNKKAFENILRKYFNKVGGFRLAADSSGVRSWFDEKGVLTVSPERDGKQLKLDEIEEIGIELDVEEVSIVEDDGKKFELLCEPGKLMSIEAELSKQKFTVESAEVEYRAKHPIPVQGDDATKVEKFYELIQEDDNTKQIAKLPRLEMNDSQNGSTKVEISSSEIQYDYEKHSTAAKYLIKSLYHVFVCILRERNALPKSHFVSKLQEGLGGYTGLNYKYEINRIIMKTFESLKNPIKNNYLKSFSLTIGGEDDPNIVFEEFKFTIDYGVIENLKTLDAHKVKSDLRKLLWSVRIMCYQLKKLPEDLTLSFQAEYTPDSPDKYQIPRFTPCHPVSSGKILDSIGVNLNEDYHKGKLSVWSQYEKNKRINVTI